jgi:hypothetical protein
MAEQNEFFDQLIRGEHPPNSYAFSSRIPQDEKAAAIQVRILLRYADDAADSAMGCIRDILRWHGGEMIRSQLSPADRDLLSKVEALVGPEYCEPDEV